MTRKALLLAVAITPLALYIIGKRIFRPNGKAAATSALVAYKNATTEIQATLPIDSGDIVFIGNSLTSNFPLNEMFGTLRIKNRGVGSSRLIDIYNRVGDIAEAKPSKLFFIGGVNDFLDRRNVSAVFRDYVKTIDRARTISPLTILYIQSTLPVRDIRPDIQPCIDSLNSMLKDFCAWQGILFINLDKVLRVGSKLDSTLTWDGIHLNSKGYCRWKKEIEKVL